MRRWTALVLVLILMGSCTAQTQGPKWERTIGTARPGPRAAVYDASRHVIWVATHALITNQMLLSRLDPRTRTFTTRRLGARRG